MRENFAPDISQTEQHEEWHKVHAQLLKSVADAQARLLAAENEISDKLTAQAKDINVLIGRVEALRDIFSGRLDAIGAILAELLTVRRPVARPAKRRKRTR